MNKRDVIKTVLEGRRPPYVPWSFSFTHEAAAKLQEHFKTQDLTSVLGNHILELGDSVGFFEPLGNDRYQDVFGVIWDRSIEKNIGNVEGCLIQEASMNGFSMPDPHAPRLFADIEEKISRHGDLFRVFQIGFSLFERAWTLRGMENLMMDMLENPDFVHELLGAIADYNIAQVQKALTYDIDAVYFGDDWGQQHGLIMGPQLWHEFIQPQLVRMYDAVHRGGKYVFIHSCGDVDELFDELTAIGVNCFNPFQPEVMDVYSLIAQHRSKLTFHGGLSTQRILPYGSEDEVRSETRRLLDAGREGGYILAPAHAVEGDVSLQNMLAFIDEAKKQVT